MSSIGRIGAAARSVVRPTEDEGWCISEQPVDVDNLTQVVKPVLCS